MKINETATIKQQREEISSIKKKRSEIGDKRAQCFVCNIDE